MANWEELPQELLKLIAQRLAIKDFVAFGAVCTSWLSAATKETYDVKSKAPWLVTNVYRQMPEFCSPSRGRIYPVKSPGTRAQTLSLRGWMLSIELPAMEQLFSKSFIGLKPFRITIKLPAMEQIFSESFLSLEQQVQRIDKIALSSSPSLSRSYAVMIAYHFAFGVPWPALHRSGEDAWKGVSPATHLQPIEVLQLIYYDGLFVALDAENHITTLNERETHMESRLVLGQKFKGRPYLVECSGSLLVAWETKGAEGNGFRVFEVDLEKGTQEEVESLGKASLFLNDNSFSMEFDAASCVPRFKPNHVYFTDHADKKKKIYSMENGKVETYGPVWFVFWGMHLQKCKYLWENGVFQ